jgi:hypothetical protein
MRKMARLVATNENPIMLMEMSLAARDCPLDVAELVMDEVIRGIAAHEEGEGGAESNELEALFFQGLYAVAQHDPGKALEYMMKQESQGATDYATTVFHKWAERDSEGALRQVAALRAAQASGQETDPFTASVDCDDLLKQVFATMAMQDSHGALTRAQQLPEDQRPAALEGVMPTLDKDAPPLEMLRLVTGDSLPDWSDVYIESGMKTDRAGLMAWAESLAPELKAAAEASIAQKWAEAEPGVAAAEWLRGRGNTDDPEILGNVINPWAQKDINAAGTWLREQIDTLQWPQANLDAAVRRFSRQAAHQNLAAGLSWAKSIRDPQIQRTTVRSILRQFRESPEIRQAAQEAGIDMQMVGEILGNTP